MEKRGLKNVFIVCLLVVVILCNTALVFANSLSDLSALINGQVIFYSDLNSYLNYAFGVYNLSIDTSKQYYSDLISTLSSYDTIFGVSKAGNFNNESLLFFVNNNAAADTDNNFIYQNNGYYYRVSSTTQPYHRIRVYLSDYHNLDYDTVSSYGESRNVLRLGSVYYNGEQYSDSVVNNNLYYTDISNEESYTNSDGVTFYTGGLSLIALAYPDFYSKLQAAAAGSAGLLEWLVNDIGAMFMLDPSTNDWYILNAPQNVAYYASDSANTLTLYSGIITEENTFKRDAGSVSFGTSADYWKHNNAVVKYNYQTQQFEYSNTFNGLTINRGANGVWINRGSSMLALNDPINEQREGLLHGRYVINNPSINNNFDQYLDNSGDDTTLIDGDLYALLNEIKNWSQVDALTQKYLLNTLSEISSFTSEVIDYLGPNYLYPTITSYFDSLFRLNGLIYSAYDQNNNKVEYNKHNKSIGDVLTEEYLMLTSIGSDNRPTQYYQYDGDVKVNPLYSLWNDIKNLPDNIASKIQPIFPTIPGSNDTIIDSVGDYNNRVSLNPKNVTDTHENLTDLLSWFHLEGFSGSFSDIFGSSDRWSLWSEETYTNCGLEVDTEE